jgi:hypothetical protein
MHSNAEPSSLMREVVLHLGLQLNEQHRVMSRRSSFIQWRGRGNSSLPASNLVIVNEGPQSSVKTPESTETEFVELPPEGDFTFESIIGHCRNEADAVIYDITNIGTVYRANLQAEMNQMAFNQRRLAMKMSVVEKTAHSVLSTTRQRVAHVQSDLKSLEHEEGGAIRAFEATKAQLESITDLLYKIDCALPESERLGPASSPHKHQYPKLHKLLLLSSAEAPPQLMLKTMELDAGQRSISISEPSSETATAQVSFAQQESATDRLKHVIDSQYIA